MRKYEYTTQSEDSSSARTRWGGAAAAFAGISYGALGYLHGIDPPDYVSAVLPVLAVATPALFLLGLVGLHSQLGGTANRLGETAFLLGFAGTGLGVFAEVVAWWPTPPIVKNWWAQLYTFNWLAQLAVSLTLVGITTLVKERLGRWGALVLTSGMFGCLSLVTDPDFSAALMPMRPVHFTFAALFSLSSIVWGCLLFREASTPSRQLGE